MSSSHCTGPDVQQAQVDSPQASSRLFEGSSIRPAPEVSVGEVAFSSVATAEGGASVSARPATGSLDFGETSGVSGSNFGPEVSDTQHVGSTADQVMPGGSANSVEEVSTVYLRKTADLARHAVPSYEAMMVGDPLAAPDAADSTGPADASTRPSDADILAWEDAIRRDGVGQRPLVGEPEPLSALAGEYASGAGVFQAKIASLEKRYGLMRRTRGDGNCFFRSLVFALVERLMLTGDEAEKDRHVPVVLARMAVVKQQLVEAGYEEMVMETPMDAMLDMLRNIGSPVEPLTIDTLEQNMRAEYISNYIVFLMRMITSCEIRRREEFFAPFIMGLSDLDVPTFCRRCVDPMDEESDHVHIVALTDALQVPLRVVYLDRSASSSDNGASSTTGEAHVDMHDFLPEGIQATEPAVHLLYRPGHYDILYLRA